MPTAPTVMETTRADVAARYVAAFEMHDGHTLNGTNVRLQGLRRAAIERFEALGFPHRKDEAWKYTNVTRLLDRGYALQVGQAEPEVSVEDVAALLVPELEAHVVVLVNGRFAPALSSVGDMPDGVVVTGLAKAAVRHADVFDRHFGQYADAEHHALTALNTAFVQDGLFVHVPAHAILERPIHLVSLFVAEEPTLFQPRALVIAEAGAQVRFVQTGGTQHSANVFINSVTEVAVEAGAYVDWYVVQGEDEQVAQVATMHARQGSGSTFRASTYTFGGELTRNNLTVLPDGEHGESHLFGLFLGRGTSHIDNHTLVDHARPKCFSNELFKGILDDRATGVFNGKVLVRQDAQQTNAYQSNKSIVLTDTAQMYAKPELEIYADDVKCSHGATSGQLDDEAIFYIRSRGLSEARARGLLLHAFALDVVDTIAIDALREWIDAQVTAYLNER